MRRHERAKTESDTSSRVIRYVLEQRQLTQAQLAEALEVSESFVSRALNGERNLTLDHLKLINDRFDMPIGAMFLAITPAGSDPKYARLRELSRELLLQGDRVIAAVKANERRKAAATPPKRATA